MTDAHHSDEQKSVEITGYQRELKSGAKVFCGPIPDDKGGGFAFSFYSKAGERTNLFLSTEAFDALASLHETFNEPVSKTYRLLLKVEAGKDFNTAESEWTQVEPSEAGAEEVPK